MLRVSRHVQPRDKGNPRPNTPAPTIRIDAGAGGRSDMVRWPAMVLEKENFLIQCRKNVSCVLQ